MHKEHSLWQDIVYEFLWLENDKTSTMRLPPKHMTKSVGFHLCNNTMKNNWKGSCYSSFSTSNGRLCWVVRLVRIVVIIVHHVMTLVLVDRLARFEMAGSFILWCCHGVLSKRKTCNIQRESCLGNNVFKICNERVWLFGYLQFDGSRGSRFELHVMILLRNRNRCWILF